MRATNDAEAQFPPITAVHNCRIELGLDAEQREVPFSYLNDAAIGPARHFLPIYAVTNDHPASMRLGLERNITTVTAAVNGNGL